MKKADLEFVTFDTEDVITTSGVDPCDPQAPHYYIEYDPNGSGRYTWYLHKGKECINSGYQYSTTPIEEGWYLDPEGKTRCLGTTHNNWRN